MSLVWIVPSLGVSVLTVVVVLQLLGSLADKSSGRLISSVVGLLLLAEGSLALLMSRNSPDATGLTTAAHGVAMILAGAGVWSLAHRPLWSRVSHGRRSE